VSRIFITGSADGLGRAAAAELMDEGHEVVLHARSRERVASLAGLAGRAAGVVIGDLSSAAQTRAVADQVNDIGRMDTAIHNAGVFLVPSRAATADGHATTVAVNTLAPYLLTALTSRPDRLIYLSSGMHLGGTSSLADIDWTQRHWSPAQAYSDSKLHVTALALTIARVWPEVRSNAVDPGWVPTRMGGPGATDDLEMGHLTQTWLAVSDDAAAASSGGYWYHRRRQAPAPDAGDPAFQDELMGRLAALTGVALPDGAGSDLWQRRQARRERKDGCSARLAGSCLRDADQVARGIAERAVARAPRLIHGLLQHLGAGCPEVLEGRAEIARLEDDHREHALGEQLLQGVPVGLGPAGVRLRQHDAEAWLVLAAQGDPAEPAGTDVVLHFEPERIPVEAE
jgi:NAD(P)-dependent dehydrogenase (short-subunit alcohol dehydrogenase family)